MPKSSQTKIDEFRIKAFWLLLLTCLSLVLIHVILVYWVLPSGFANGPYYAVHAFFVPLTLFAFDRMARKFAADHQSAVKSISSYIFVKMFATVMFLIPWVLMKSDYLTELVYQFLVLFFLLLIIEKILLARLIKIPFEN
jgi:hypothetical protein